MKKNASSKNGFSLVEIMVAILLLAVLALGGAAVLYQTGGGIQVAGNKRVALELARSELEALSMEDYFVLRSRAAAGNPETLTWSEAHNGVTLSISTINQLITTGGIMDVMSGGSEDNEYLELRVEVQYRPSSSEKVVVETTKVFVP